MGVAERVFAVALPEGVAVFGGHGGEETERGVLQHGGVLLVLLPEAALEVVKDDDARLGAVWCHVLISPDGHHAHGWDCLGNPFGQMTEAAVLLEDDLGVGVVVLETLLLLVL
jgi:hypothetical protein